MIFHNVYAGACVSTEGAGEGDFPGAVRVFQLARIKLKGGGSFEFWTGRRTWGELCEVWRWGRRADDYESGFLLALADAEVDGGVFSNQEFA